MFHYFFQIWGNQFLCWNSPALLRSPHWCLASLTVAKFFSRQKWRSSHSNKLSYSQIFAKYRFLSHPPHPPGYLKKSWHLLLKIISYSTSDVPERGWKCSNIQTVLPSKEAEQGSQNSSVQGYCVWLFCTVHDFHCSHFLRPDDTPYNWAVHGLCNCSLQPCPD